MKNVGHMFSFTFFLSFTLHLIWMFCWELRNSLQDKALKIHFLEYRKRYFKVKAYELIKCKNYFKLKSPFAVEKYRNSHKFYVGFCNIHVTFIFSVKSIVCNTYNCRNSFKSIQFKSLSVVHFLVEMFFWRICSETAFIQDLFQLKVEENCFQHPMCARVCGRQSGGGNQIQLANVKSRCTFIWF